MKERKLGHFFTQRLSDGRYVALSGTAPFFCFRADSEAAVLARVKNALLVYGQFRDLGEPTIIKAPTVEQSVTTLNAPKKVEFSEVYATA
jgi:hypothetical protein